VPLGLGEIRSLRNIGFTIFRFDVERKFEGAWQRDEIALTVERQHTCITSRYRDICYWTLSVACFVVGGWWQELVDLFSVDEMCSMVVLLRGNMFVV
jgi:hypothetical protein